MRGNAPSSPITGVPGWETVPEQHYLIKLAKEVPDNGVIVEIGAEFGQSSSLFVRAIGNKNIRIISIDLFPGDLQDIYLANMREAGMSGRTESVKMNSKDFINSCGSLDIDLLFVDGDHSHDGVKLDIDNYAPKVRVGGVIAFHDCACVSNKMPHTLHFEVTRAITEWFVNQVGAWKVLESIDSILAFRRLYA
jgi:predicted O-methyltransferase YrrM